ncbi:MAG: PD-(D/E)XK nuclease family protein [Anaerolineae bacterium]|nr:PD-(D/E)XK nuclease family protein [Gemmatimonadaceae bacterium]
MATDLLRRRGASFGIRIVTLSALPREVERRARVVSPPDADPLATTLIVERAVRAAASTAFEESTPVEGLVVRAMNAIELIQRNGGTRAEFARVIKREAKSDTGARLLSDIWNRTERATVRLARARPGRTRAEALANATALLRDTTGALAGCDLVVIENVPLRTVLERRIIAALIGAAPGDVLAAYECASQLELAPMTRSLATIRNIAFWREISCQPPATRMAAAISNAFLSPSIRTNPASAVLRSGPEVTLLEAAGEVAEVRFATRIVRRHLREGVPASEIALVVHNQSRYLGLIQEMSRGEGIPLSLRRNATVASTGLGETLLRLLALVVEPDGPSCRNDTLAVLRAPHLGFTQPQRNALEREILKSGLLGAASWTRLTPRNIGAHAYARALRVRDVLLRTQREFAALRSAAEGTTIALRLARDLRLVRNVFAGRRRAIENASEVGLRALAEEAVRQDNVAWEAIRATLEEIPALMEATGLTAGQKGRPLAQLWLSTLRRALESARIGGRAAPAAGVRVAGTGAGYESASRVTIVLGMSEKLFPRQARQDPFLRDATKRALRASSGWELPSSDELIEGERERFLRSVATAGEHLYFTCAVRGGDGRPTVSSFFLDDLAQSLGSPLTRRQLRASDLTPAIADAATRGELLAAVSNDLWQHLPAAHDRDARRLAAFHAYDTLRIAAADIGPVTGARSPIQQPLFDAELFDGAPHRTLHLSASQLNSLGHCTYKHFVEKVLRPDNLEPPEHNALERGSLIHGAIAQWVHAYGGWKGGDSALAQADHWVAAQIEKWSPIVAGSARARHDAEETRVRLQDFLRTERDRVLVAGAAAPSYAELAFGQEAYPDRLQDPASVATPLSLVLPTSAGQTTVHFRGSIDRVDIVQVGGRQYGVAIDYKSGRDSKFYARGMRVGNDLQLRLYLLALERLWGITPGGAFFLGFGDGTLRGVILADIAGQYPAIGEDSLVLGGAEWQRFVNDETTALIANLVSRLINLDITPQPRDNDCGFCELACICRFERYAVRRELEPADV